ncbi:ribonuclease H2 subunit [Babesia ovata]|uniref:Ribonuclease H2 subunit n=1 Tax=Babesia ovata TaxID=189622 RepID=A0A2H6K916_9APIC|nr:ribonuclease H2 subunit [Babesia ovata]GBE59487.1 ribonuclease H2 subunit [Babesia ovata]
MFMGSSSFISMGKALKKKPPNTNADARRLMFVDSIIKADSVEVVQLPNATNLMDGTLYAIFDGKLYLIRGIQPNVHPVSLFVNNTILNQSFLATFKFDVIFIFTSIVFLEPDKFMSMPQRIYELYRSGLNESQGHGALEAGTFALWNNNVDNIQERIRYLCETANPSEAKDPLIKPNMSKFRAMLEYKVQCLEKAARNSNIMMGPYCQSNETSNRDNVRKHYITFQDSKLRSFAWSVISSMLNAEARNCLIPSNASMADKQAVEGANTSTKPVIKSGKKPKQRKIAVASGTVSITTFFKPAL